jgi:hypothetical protein
MAYFCQVYNRESSYRNMAFYSALAPIRNILHTQFSRDLNMWQICDEIAKKSSKIVPLGAPFLPQTLRPFETREGAAARKIKTVSKAVPPA